MLAPYADLVPERKTVDATPGALILEFGSNECGICKAALPLITEALKLSKVPHVRVQDGRGKRLGRSFGIKLWPTLIMLRDGQEVARVVRPGNAEVITHALSQLQNQSWE